MKLVSEVKLPKNIFGSKVNLSLMAQAVRVYLSNKRQGNAKTKTRSEVAFTTKKIWKQKGTGKARHGAKSAPIFVKGGVAHGPTGEQNYHLSLNKKMRKLALKSALLDKLKNNKLIIVEGLDKIKTKTAEFEKIIKKLVPTLDKRITLVISKQSENINRVSRNLPYINLLEVKHLSAYPVLNSQILLVTKESLKNLEELCK